MSDPTSEILHEPALYSRYAMATEIYRLREALTEQAHPECHADCHPAAFCDGPEQARAHAEHLALCAEAQARTTRERLQLEDRVAAQAREIERLTDVLRNHTLIEARLRLSWSEEAEKMQALQIQWKKTGDERDALRASRDLQQERADHAYRLLAAAQGET